MKNTLLKTIGTAVMTILMLALFAQVRVFAQDNAQTEEQIKEQTSKEMSGQRDDDEGLVGTWDAEVTIRNCQTGAPLRTFVSITTFMTGGVMIDSTSGIPQAGKTPGHGVWNHIRRNTYGFKTKSFTFDPTGTPTGWIIVKHQGTLNRRADEFESSGTSEVYNMTGNLIASGCSTAASVRFEL